jgi:hypothetical protein
MRTPNLSDPRERLRLALWLFQADTLLSDDVPRPTAPDELAACILDALAADVPPPALADVLFRADLKARAMAADMIRDIIPE